jgi:hypothetical protein
MLLQLQSDQSSAHFLYKKRRERERERERERFPSRRRRQGFTSPIAADRERLDEKTRDLSHLRKWGFGEKRFVTLSGVYAFLTRVVWNRLTTIYTFRRILLCCIDRRRSRSWRTVYFAKHRKLSTASFNKNYERSAIAAGLCRCRRDLFCLGVCIEEYYKQFLNFIIYENSFSDKKTFSDHLSHGHHWVHIFCNFFNNIFGSSCTISIGCTFCAISLIIFSVHHLASCPLAHFV